MTRSNSPPRIIDDSRTIAGLLREALFLQRPLTVRFDGRIHELAIQELVENSSRNRTEERGLRVEWISEPPPSDAGDGSAEFECAFFEFVASWTGGLRVQCGRDWILPLPERLEIRNLRESRRHELGKDRIHLNGTVLVHSNEYHMESRLRITNVSREGLGGVLAAPRDFPIAINSTIRGVLHGNPGGFQLDGILTHISLAGAGRTASGDIEYRLGIRRRDVLATANTPIQTERRRYGRRRASDELRLRSPFNPVHIIRVKLRELSVAGFSAEPSDPHDALLLPVGAIVQGEDPALLFRLVAVSEAAAPLGVVFRFQIHAGMETARLAWLRRVAGADSPGKHHASATGGDIIELFCRAGALSSEYLRNNRSRSDSMVSGFASGGAHMPWLHRWIERDAEGGAIGHIGAVKLADSLWHVGDLTGSPEPGRKISRSFIPRFLTGFRDFCLTSSPCPRVIMTWNTGHPYWRRYEAYLENEGKASIHYQCRTRYTRFRPGLPDLKAGAEGDWLVREIRAHEHAEIESLLSTLAARGLDALARGMDFCISSFGSPGLGALASGSEGGFFRRYFTIVRGEFRYLVVLSRFPDGSSPSRTFDVPWVLPLQHPFEPAGGAGAPPPYIACVHKLALESGCAPPGVLEPVFHEGATGAGASAAGKTMTWMIGHPSILDFFEEEESA